MYISLSAVAYIHIYIYTYVCILLYIYIDICVYRLHDTILDIRQESALKETLNRIGLKKALGRQSSSARALGERGMRIHDLNPEP